MAAAWRATLTFFSPPSFYLPVEVRHYKYNSISGNVHICETVCAPPVFPAATRSPVVLSSDARASRKTTLLLEKPKGNARRQRGAVWVLPARAPRVGRLARAPRAGPRRWDPSRNDTTPTPDPARRGLVYAYPGSFRPPDTYREAALRFANNLSYVLRKAYIGMKLPHTVCGTLPLRTSAHGNYGFHGRVDYNHVPGNGTVPRNVPGLHSLTRGALRPSATENRLH